MGKVTEVATTTCDLTPRCRKDANCRHHAKGCEHNAEWVANSEVMAKDLDSMRAEIAVFERIRDELLTLSWEGRRRVLQWMWGRFIEHPRCTDDPVETAPWHEFARLEGWKNDD